MRKKLTLSLILIFAVCLLLIVCRFLFIAEKPLLDQVKFYESVYGRELDPYYDEEEDIYYIFLPAYADLENINIECAEFVKGDFSNDFVDFGSDMAELPLSEPITLTLTNFYQKETYNFQIWQCDNLPTVYIETETGSMDSVNADKDYEEDASVLVINADGSTEVSDMGIISGRGQGTWGAVKKPYVLKFDTGIDIGPFDSAKTLCLLANYSDESRIRNAIAYYAGKKIGISYASPYMNVNVYTNGEYLGLYGIVTKYEYQQYIESDQIKAVFEMSTSISADEESFITKFNDRVNVMYGDESEVQYAVGQMEAALRAQDWELCDSLIDIESFAEKYIFDEFFGNYDTSIGGGSYTSKYFYLGDDGLIHCMLPWDYDWSLGSARSFFNNVQAYELNVYRNEQSWFTVLLNNDDFVSEVCHVLKSKFTDEYLNDISQYVAYLINDVYTSWECDKIRWKDERPFNSWNESSGFEDLYEFMDYFNTYFWERRSFLIDYFSNPDGYCRVQLRTDNYGQDYFNIFIPVGENLWDYLSGANILDENRLEGSTFSGWYTENGMSVYDVGIVTEDLFFIGEYASLETSEVNEDNTTTLSETETAEPSDSSPVVNLLKRIYHFFGLGSFGRRRIALCGVFGIFFVALIVEEAVRYSRERKAEK